MFALPDGLHGAYLRDELVAEIGLSAVRMLLRHGQLLRYSRNVLVARRRSTDLLTRSAAALLLVGPDAILNTHTALALHGCGAAETGKVHVLSGYTRKVRPRPWLVLHHQSHIDEGDVLELDGLRMLAMEPALVEMLCTISRPVALACLDQALAMVDPQFRALLREALSQRLAERADRRGTRRAQALLGLATGVTESPAESAVLLVIFDAGLPMPRLQCPVHDLDGHERYRLDFAWEEPKVALEYDGYEAHDGREQADARRDADLRARGWLVIRAKAADLRDPANLIAALRGAFARRRYAA